jgi:protein TonB
VADRSALRRLGSRILGGIAVLALVYLFVSFVDKMMSMKSSKPERVVQNITVIRPPPPPPPPDQPPPPPPEKIEQQLPQDQPQPTPDEPDQAPPDTLANDGPAAAGGDSFGMHQGSGGTPLGGAGNAPFAWYTTRMRDAIKERLAASPCVKSAKGSLLTRIVVGADGRVKQIKLTASTGNSHVDECVEKALSGYTSIGTDPPSGMPEAVELRIVF